ncbi:hypothetical protein GCM10008021_31670 [Deinococcus wulumuqiensis]|uniref:Uncharacterized protein n=1 Tax=Deinococcus wulumuqiensis TaxID=980427 RepID=A0ABQ2CBR4_9DEIO|nr:hypothetical protein GCM10008021_31670 [Deinococcus wulumuqiensis]
MPRPPSSTPTYPPPSPPAVLQGGGTGGLGVEEGVAKGVLAKPKASARDGAHEYPTHLRVWAVFVGSLEVEG